VVNVHRSLLCNVSEAMRNLVQEAEDGLRSAEPKKKSKFKKRSIALMESVKRDHVRPRIDLFEHEILSGHERGLQLWAGFLYGQSMSIVPSEWYKDATGPQVASEYDALLRVREIALTYHHDDAEDAALDTIRDLLYHRDDMCIGGDVLAPTPHASPLDRMLIDFAVYREQGKAWTEFIDGRLGPIDCPNPALRPLFEANREQQPLDELLRITNALCKMFIRKEADATVGSPLPDLMERCRYHTHGEKGLPCYLDK
jgi:hypothetical protein